MPIITPLEKATDFNRWSLPLKADGGLKPPSAQAVRERSSLTGFTLCFSEGPLAHPVEHRPFKAGVPRSSRGWPIMICF